MIKEKSGLIVPCPELRGSLQSLKYPVFAEIKKDGEFNFIHIDKNHQFCINKNGTIKRDFPTLNDLSERILKEFESITFLGELVYKAGVNGDLYELLKKENEDKLGLYLFDVLEINKKDLRNSSLLDRCEIFYDIRSGIDRTNPPNENISITLPARKMIYSEEEAKKYFEYSVNKSWEGIVLKPMESKIVFGPCEWVKMKFKDQNDYPIANIDPTQERMEIRVPLFSPGSHLRNEIFVGVKVATKYKKHLTVGQLVTIEHQGQLAGGGLRHPVLIPRKEWK